jgi:hypothetical protein
MKEYLLGGGLEPPRLTAYAPQTYVSAISPPERFGGTQLVSRTMFPASVSSGRRSVVSCQLSVKTTDPFSCIPDFWFRIL